MTKLRWLIAGILGMTGTVLFAQIFTFLVVADARMPRTLEELLPPSSRCSEILASGNWLQALNPEDRQAVEGLLNSRFTKVYLDELDIPASALVYDSNGDVVRLVELKGVCDFLWHVDGSGPFWFRAVYFSDMGMHYRGSARVTYLWLLFKWVVVRTDIGGHA